MQLRYTKMLVATLGGITNPFTDLVHDSCGKTHRAASSPVPNSGGSYVDTWGCANNRSRTNIVPADHTSVVSDTLGLSLQFVSQMLQKFRTGELYHHKRASSAVVYLSRSSSGRLEGLSRSPG